MANKFKAQTGDTWIDPMGQSVPKSYISPKDKYAERKAVAFANKAENLSKQLKALKDAMREATHEIWQQTMKARGVEVDPENAKEVGFTWYNVDHTIKVEGSIQHKATYNEAEVQAAKIHFDDFIDDNLSTKDTFVRKLIQDAFATKRKQYDLKKLMSLLRYKDQVKDERFKQAIECLEQAIVPDTSTAYYRLYLRNDDNSYSLVNLNFSAL